MYRKKLTRRKLHAAVGLLSLMLIIPGMELSPVSVLAEGQSSVTNESFLNSSSEWRENKFHVVRHCRVIDENGNMTAELSDELDCGELYEYTDARVGVYSWATEHGTRGKDCRKIETSGYSYSTVDAEGKAYDVYSVDVTYYLGVLTDSTTVEEDAYLKKNEEILSTGYELCYVTADNEETALNEAKTKARKWAQSSASEYGTLNGENITTYKNTKQTFSRLDSNTVQVTQTWYAKNEPASSMVSRYIVQNDGSFIIQILDGSGNVMSSHAVDTAPGMSLKIGESATNMIYRLEYTGSVRDGQSANVSILSGSDRYETAADIARTAFPSGASEVVIVTGEKFPDALAANAYAGAQNIPLLIVNYNGGLPNAIKDLLVNTWGGKVTKATFIGGGWTAQVEADLRNCGISTFSSIVGNTRMETAEKVCQSGLDDSRFTKDACVIATGNNPADALSMSTWCYKYHIPLLLADNGQISSETANLAKQFGTIYVAGGSSVVSDSVLQGAGITSYKRLSGNTRFETSVEIAKYFTAISGSFDGTCYACGENKNFPDALVGGMLSGQTGAPIILVNDNSSSSYEYSQNTVKSASPSTVYILGAAANGSMYSQITASLR